MEKDQFVGITESGEVAFNLDVFDHLYNANIIITKRLTSKLIEKLIEHKNNIILHLTITGFGGSVIEPNVPDMNIMYNKTVELINKGFPVNQIVLRIDPIIPTHKGISIVDNVIFKFIPLGIKRLRFSIIDMYNHVKERFINNKIKLPFSTFHAPLEYRLEIYDHIKKICEPYNVSIEVCGEPGIESISCISEIDIDILGLKDKIILIGSKKQRKSCGCPSNKKELLKVGKPHQCEHKCMYCFWQ